MGSRTFLPEPGWVHANDRQLHTLLASILLQGRAAELLKAGDALVGIDTELLAPSLVPEAVAWRNRLPRFNASNKLGRGWTTILQGRIFKHAGRLTTFSPGHRMIAAMATDRVHTNLLGGPSDRHFFRWYLNDLKNGYEGNYKVLK